MTIESESPELFGHLSDEELVTHLAALTEMQFESMRELIAKNRGWRLSKLDNFVHAARCTIESNDRADNRYQGKVIKLREPEPWPEPVNGAELLDEISETINRHMVMRSVDIDTCVVWSVHTHVFELFSHTPRLLITAPDAECGKTLLMVYMVGDLCNRPQSTELMKPAPFFRMITAYQPTFLIDEADVFLKEDLDLVAAINNGWEPHGGVHRCVGDDLEVREFSTYCPVALAGIEMHKRLKATTISRSLIIYLDRAADGEIPKSNIYDKKKHRKCFMTLARKIARWCQDNRNKIRTCEPELPDGLRNRGADKWRPMMALAEIAGGNWPERIRIAISRQPDIAEPTRALQLLDDVYRIIGDAKGVHTAGLLYELSQMQDAPWNEYNFKERDLDRRMITDRQVANLLKKYGVSPDDIRMPNGVKRGYYREKVEMAWKRYIGESSTTTLQPSYTSNSDVVVSSVFIAQETTRTSSGKKDTTLGCSSLKGCSTVAENPPIAREHPLIDNDSGWVDINPDETI